MIRFLKYLLLSLVLICTILWLGTKNSFNPIQRDEISKPIYTIGDINYLKAINKNKKIIKFGPMLWGLYPGGLVFKDPLEAQKYILKNKNLLKKFSSGWAIYQLSGDLNLDTKKIKEQLYLNKSLLITKQIIIPKK